MQLFLKENYRKNLSLKFIYINNVTYLHEDFLSEIRREIVLFECYDNYVRLLTFLYRVNRSEEFDNQCF
jgi:hypothetical protein